MDRCRACGSSAPVRVEHEGDAAAWVTGTQAPNVQGHGLPQPRELWPYQSLFFAVFVLELLVTSNQKASLASLSP